MERQFRILQISVPAKKLLQCLTHQRLKPLLSRKPTSQAVKKSAVQLLNSHQRPNRQKTFSKMLLYQRTLTQIQKQNSAKAIIRRKQTRLLGFHYQQFLTTMHLQSLASRKVLISLKKPLLLTVTQSLLKLNLQLIQMVLL